jgi:hypothetical protein
MWRSEKLRTNLSFDSSKTGIHTRRWTAALFGLLGKLSAEAIEGGFDSGLFGRHDFVAPLHGHIWRLDLNN